MGRNALNPFQQEITRRRIADITQTENANHPLALVDHRQSANLQLLHVTHAGISYALTDAMDEGHCGLPTDDLVPLAEKAVREIMVFLHSHGVGTARAVRIFI
jgi:hypothetical protein